MRRSLESVKKPLDANVEKDGAKEITDEQYDSYSLLWDDYKTQHQDDLDALENADEYDFLLDDYKTQHQDELDALENADEYDFLWDEIDLGKYTIGESTLEKQAAQEQEKFMNPIGKEEEVILSPEENKMMKEAYEKVLSELEGRYI